VFSRIECKRCAPSWPPRRDSVSRRTTPFGCSPGRRHIKYVSRDTVMGTRHANRHTTQRLISSPYLVSTLVYGVNAKKRSRLRRARALMTRRIVYYRCRVPVPIFPSTQQQLSLLLWGPRSPAVDSQIKRLTTRTSRADSELESAGG